MSRAFVREVDGTAETPLPPARNPERGYMTEAGVERHRGRLRHAHVTAVLQGAIVIRLASPPRDEVRFGAQVVVEDDRGFRSRFQLVGENEAAPERQLVNWFSPLGRALAGAKLGERVECSTSGGRRVQVLLRPRAKRASTTCQSVFARTNLL